MLQSPGHSPRLIPLSPSPDHLSETPILSASASISRKRQIVLDEDSYVEAIEKIVERDYFPDIPKLRDRLDWIEAIRSGDPVQIRDCQLKIIERRAVRSAIDSSEHMIRTPASNFLASSLTPFGSERLTPAQSSLNPTSEEDSESDNAVNTSMSLDEFLRRHTSEDNESFSRILEKVNKKRNEKYGYLLTGENLQTKTLETERRDRITDGYGTSGQPPSTLDGWKYSAKNLLMYDSASCIEVSLTEEEKAERAKGLTKEISRVNTRFHGKILDSRPKEDDTVAILYTPIAGASPNMAPFADREAERARKYDLEDLRKTPNAFYAESDKKSKDGYSFVRTPSPAPGVDGSPFITWGEIEGTPLRLEAEDTPVDIGGSGDGPHFTILNLPSRDRKAHSLSREAARKLRERAKLFQKPPLPSPVRGGSMSPNVRNLSPAAQKFVRNAMAKSSSSVDQSLRASYRGLTPVASSPRRSLTRFARDGSLGSRSPS